MFTRRMGSSPINRTILLICFFVEDGNDFDQLRDAFNEAHQTKGQPIAIVMKTVKGKGISFMENQVGWHGKAPDDEEFAIAMEELKKAGEALCQK